MTASPDTRPLIAHVLFRFDVGGLENGVVNLINHLPEWKWRHTVIALDDIAPGFARRVERQDVAFHALRKPAGHLVGQYPRLVRLFRDVGPAIIHTRNLAALEATPPAWFAGIAARVHGEHGWDVHDLDGTSSRYRRLRQLFRPFVQHYIALSDQIASYLQRGVGIDPLRVTRIYNGVDTGRFRPADSRTRRELLPFSGSDLFVVGTVGRLQAVKDQVSLIGAFSRLVRESSAARSRLRLVIVGEGPVRAQLEEAIRREGLAGIAWLAGERDDVAELMQCFDLFVLSSLSEGISNTILEAMSTALPVIATRVGGNAELVVDGVTGAMVPSADPVALATAIGSYLLQPALVTEHGVAGRRRIEERFSIQSMVAAYDSVYEALLPARALQKRAELGA